MAIEAILNALPKYRKSGDKYRAPCPVHDGKDFNLMLSERSDGSVGAYCFVCHANGLQIADALGVDRKELFAPDADWKPSGMSREMKVAYGQDLLVLAMAENRPYESLSLADKRRLRLARARIEGIEQRMVN